MLCSTYTDFVTYSQNDFGWQYDFRGILDRVQAESHIAIFIYIIISARHRLSARIRREHDARNQFERPLSRCTPARLLY